MPALQNRFHPVLLSACVASLMLFSGCSSSSKAPESEDGETGQEQAAAAGTSTSGQGVSGKGLVTTGPGGKTMIGGVPVDVWYDDPLAVVAQTGNVSPAPVAPQTAQGTAETPTETPTEEPPAEPPKAASADWDKIIPTEVLDAEVKSIRNFLTPTLRTVGSYNSEVKQIPTFAMTMAALAQVALHHSGDPLWKDNAAALRDLSYNLANAADGPGRKSFDAATLQFENILLIFNGTSPELEETPDPEAAFADHVDRGPIMQRIDLAHKWLTSNTPTAAALKESKEKASHETAILATLVKISGDQSYLFSDEPEYQKFVSDVMEATEKMRDSIETENYDGFRESLNVVSRKCTECHTPYRNAN